MTFQLDMSGEVALSLSDGVPWEIAGGHRWSDLSPFVQGYVEALLRSVGIERLDALAPETLARIIADCEDAARILGRFTRADDGGWFWNGGARRPGFPPLTVQLGDDGKVRFVG